MAVIMERFFYENGHTLKKLKGYSKLREDYQRLTKAKAPDIANDMMAKRILEGTYDGYDINMPITLLFRKFAIANTDFVGNGGRP